MEPSGGATSLGDGHSIVLASGSPRRRRLLELLGLAFQIDPADVEEVPEPDEAPEVFCERAARDKAAAVAARHPDRHILAADTVVALEGDILGKPESPGHARAMLRRLSGRTHRVHTAMALARDGELVSLVDTAQVEILPLDDALISWYVATGEPLDKAGAYAVQGRGGLLVSAVHGHPHTVVGLPIHRLPELFAALGFDVLSRLGSPTP
ncbi:MAG TPA: septum formation protein Maf [Acidobacteria bacterium]|nr:septum formation protein Maf [Acidobacteriota bacterium]